jgi:hypothetical protein
MVVYQGYFSLPGGVAARESRAFQMPWSRASSASFGLDLARASCNVPTITV